jgi:hypothetical protein
MAWLSLWNQTEASGKVGLFRRAGTVRYVGLVQADAKPGDLCPTRLETRTKESTF